MSSGHGKKEDPEVETTYITMDPEEFNRVCKRLSEMLSSRVEKAWKKKKAKPSQKSIDNHVEATKDAYAFIHLLDLVDQMSQEIAELRELVEGEPVEDVIFQASAGKKYMN